MPSLHYARAGLSRDLLRPPPAERRADLGFSLTAPFTFTTIISPTQSTTSDTATSTSTDTPLPPLTTPTTTSSSSFSTFTTSSRLTFTTPETTPVNSSPSVSVLPSNAPTNATDQVAASTTKLPAGGIVGITIGGLIIILLAIVLLLRFRFRQNRELRRRSWVNKPGVPSRAVTGVTASSFAPAEKFPETAVVSPGLSFAQQQQTIPAIFRSNVGASGGMASGTTATVKFTFNPALSDELQIVSGELLTIQQTFDDGWALCANSNGETGMVPLECLEQGGATQTGLAVGTAREIRNSRRTSSLISSPGPIPFPRR